MSKQVSTALLGAVFLLGSGALVPTAHATLQRWQDVSFTRTYNDGIALTGASLDGYKVIDTMAVPFFTLDGIRYELTDDVLVSGPAVDAADGAMVIEATYRVSTHLGVVEVTVSHALFDEDTVNPDLAELSSRIDFAGPSGDYGFYWRIDPDLRGAAGDRVQVFDELGSRGAWQAPEREAAVELTGALEFGRHKVRFNDGPDFAHQTQLRLSANGDAVAYLVAAHDNEWEVLPEDLVNDERLQSIQSFGVLPQPIQGSDLVLWYRADISGDSGSAGPEMRASTVVGRQSVIEMDRMPSTEYPPEVYNRNGELISIESAFGKAGITINQIYKDGTIADKERLSIAELDAVMESSMDYQATQDTETQWYSWFGIVQDFIVTGVLGIMADYYEYSSDEAYREGAFAFYVGMESTLPLLETVGYPPQDLDLYLLWTVTHETGHAYNQHHEDFWYDENSCFYENSAIMGYSYDAYTLVWDFGPNSSASMRGGDPDEYVRPGHGVDFVNLEDPFIRYPYDTTFPHRRGHHDTQQFTGGGCD